MHFRGSRADSSLPMPVVAAGSPPAPVPARSDLATLRRLFPYLWDYKWRAVAALSFMIGAKLANVGVPLLLKKLVDVMNIKPGDAQAVLVVPAALLLAYGLLRLSTTIFTELREWVFAKATEGAARRISLEVFRHLHALSLRFHLERQTGGMTRDIERGTRGVHSLISYSLYSIFPTLIEVTLVLSLLAVKFDVWFAGITGIALVFYIIYTVTVTEWRTQFRKTMNELDSSANSRATRGSSTPTDDSYHRLGPSWIGGVTNRIVRGFGVASGTTGPANVSSRMGRRGRSIRKALSRQPNSSP